MIYTVIDLIKIYTVYIDITIWKHQGGGMRGKEWMGRDEMLRMWNEGWGGMRAKGWESGDKVYLVRKSDEW